MRILIVEDDEVIGERLVHTLKKEGYVVDLAPDGEEGFEMAQMHAYACIILDLMLPKRDGWSVCEGLRKRKVTTPILMLTARDTVGDRVKGLDTGADDYLPKPFDFSELLARIRALVRREQVHKRSTFRVADLEIDSAHRAVTRNGEAIHLTPREYSLLEALAKAQGRTLTREIIIESVWADEESFSNTVNFHMTSLRKKIDVGRSEGLIETVHGFGYRLRSTAEEA